MKEKIYIIGLGKAGSAISIELKDAGYNVAFVTDRNAERMEEFSNLLKPVSVSLTVSSDFIRNSDIIIICVQDRMIKDVIKEISDMKFPFDGKYFMHISGSETSEIFEKEIFNNEFTASMHPIQTFNKTSRENNQLLKNIYFGIEGGKKCLECIKIIIQNLNSGFIEIPKDKKNLYHSACVISSNFLITLLNISAEVMSNIGIERSKTYEIFEPIIKNTLKNISEDGLINSLTGPFERNDIETVSNHLSSINSELPSLIPFYTLLGMETVKVAFKKESLNLKNVISLLDLMNEYIKKESEIYKKTIN